MLFACVNHLSDFGGKNIAKIAITKHIQLKISLDSDVPLDIITDNKIKNCQDFMMNLYIQKTPKPIQ